MLGAASQKQAVIELIAAGDEEYKQCFARYREAEQVFRQVEKELPQEARDAVWDYVMACEAVSDRLLQIACNYVELQGKMIQL